MVFYNNDDKPTTKTAVKTFGNSVPIDYNLYYKPKVIKKGIDFSFFLSQNKLTIKTSF